MSSDRPTTPTGDPGTKATAWPAQRSASVPSRPADRGASAVIGVALLAFVTVASLVALTAGIGAVVDGGAAAASADRVAGEFADLDPSATTGQTSARVPLGDGRVGLVARDVRVLPAAEATDPSPTVRARYRAGGLVYRTDDADGDGRGRRVAAVGGAVVRGGPGRASFVARPRLTVGPDALVVGLPVWSTAGSGAGPGTGTLAAGGGRGAVTLTVTVDHDRRSFPAGGHAIAVETATPGPFERLFAERGATVYARDYDGDGLVSVVGVFGGSRELFVVRHESTVEVTG